MNLYLLEQDSNGAYDTYDSCVVVANSAEEAVLITPDGDEFEDRYSSWASSPADVTATLIGVADESLSVGSVVCSSFNAG